MATMVQPVRVDWPSVYASSSLAKSNAAYVDEMVRHDALAHKPLELRGSYAQSFGVQCSVLLHKFNLAWWRRCVGHGKVGRRRVGQKG